MGLPLGPLGGDPLWEPVAPRPSPSSLSPLPRAVCPRPLTATVRPPAYVSLAVPSRPLKLASNLSVDFPFLASYKWDERPAKCLLTLAHLSAIYSVELWPSHATRHSDSARVRTLPAPGDWSGDFWQTSPQL